LALVRQRQKGLEFGGGYMPWAGYKWLGKRGGGGIKKKNAQMEASDFKSLHTEYQVRLSLNTAGFSHRKPASTRNLEHFEIFLGNKESWTAG
jgi:hypothetical protein